MYNQNSNIFMFSFFSSYLFWGISCLRNTKIPQADYFSTNYDLFEVMRKKFVEKILASCCQHVNGIRFEESTMTKYKTVGPGGRGASFAPPSYKILANKEANPFPPKGLSWITTLSFSSCVNGI